VTDADGVKVAKGHLHSAPQILDADLLSKLSIDPLFRDIPPPPPTDACKHGHKDWYLSDGRYRCRPCKQSYYQKNKVKLAKRYKEKRAKLLAERGIVPVKRKRRKKNV
jgi:transposase-like protein